MALQIQAEHELHRRRLSRNVGLGVVLIVFVALVYGMTVAKVGSLDAPRPAATVTSAAGAGAGQ